MRADCVTGIVITAFTLALPARAGHEDAQPASCACFAPGTDLNYIQRHYAALWDNRGAYVATDRWSGSATSGATPDNGDPITLTYSFVPDGVITTSDGPVTNTLRSTLNSQFGSEAAWKAIFAQVFEDWGERCGINFVEEPNDDSALWPNTPGALGVRGDIRIICATEDGPNNVLAYAYFPDWGDVKLDADETWNAPANGYRFMRNTLMHELGHAIGLEHTFPTDGTKLMEPYLNTGFDGPQDDDLRGANFFYGDAHEANDSAGAAASLGAFSSGATIGGISLHNAGDIDWFSLSASSGSLVGVRAAPVGSTYSVGASAGSVASLNTRAILPLRVEIYNQTGATLLSSGTAAAGATASAVAVAVPAGDTGVRVKVASTGATNDTQRLELVLHQDSGVQRTLNVTSSGSAGVTIAAAPGDLFGLSSGVTPAALVYSDGSSVTLTAPSSAGGESFSRWRLDGVPQAANQVTLTVTMNADHAVDAVYGDALFVYAGADQTTVQGESVTLTASAGGGTSPYSYAWAPSASLSSASEAVVSAAPSADTLYTITVTDAHGQAASDSVMVKVTPALRASAGADRTVLAGQAFTLSGSASGGTAPYQYAWTPAPAGSETAQSITTSVSQMGEFLLRVTDAQQRVSTDTVRVVVADPLTVSLGEDRAVVAGGSIHLEPVISGGAAPYDALWINESGVAVSEAASLDVQMDSDVVLTLRVQDSLGSLAEDTIRLTAAPVLRVSVAASAVRVTPGEVIEVEATAVGGAAPYVTRWRPAEAVDDANASQTFAQIDEDVTLTATIEDASGQTASASVSIELMDETLVAGDTEEADGKTPIYSPPLCGFGIVSAAPLMAMSCVRWRGRRPRRRSKP